MCEAVTTARTIKATSLPIVSKLVFASRVTSASGATDNVLGFPNTVSCCVVGVFFNQLGSSNGVWAVWSPRLYRAEHRC